MRLLKFRAQLRNPADRVLAGLEAFRSHLACGPGNWAKYKMLLLTKRIFCLIVDVKDIALLARAAQVRAAKKETAKYSVLAEL